MNIFGFWTVCQVINQKHNNLITSENRCAHDSKTTLKRIPQVQPDSWFCTHTLSSSSNDIMGQKETAPVKRVCPWRTSPSVLHSAGVSLRLREDAGGGGVPLQLVHASVGQNATEDGGALQISCGEGEKRRSGDVTEIREKRLETTRSRSAYLVCTLGSE